MRSVTLLQRRGAGGHLEQRYLNTLAGTVPKVLEVLEGPSCACHTLALSFSLRAHMVQNFCHSLLVCVGLSDYSKLRFTERRCNEETYPAMRAKLLPPDSHKP